MNVERVIPRGEADADSVLQEVSRAPSAERPFSDTLVGFCAEFARRLGQDARARRYPELTALAFWMRRPELARLREEFAALEGATLLRVPRGVVFHVPPANVDTMFVYSWMLSLLCGNRNVVRLSRNRGDAVEILCQTLRKTFEEAAPPSLAAGQQVIAYGHEEDVNRALSSGCDVRVVWGGDRTVELFRQFRLRPLARELVFPDRFSLAAFSAEAVSRVDATGLEQLCESFFNDAFWFDQMGCSSPRLIVWAGPPGAAEAASEKFFGCLASVASRKTYAAPPAARMERFTFECRAILDRRVAARREHGAAFTRLWLESLEDFDREHCGGGLFFEAAVANLRELGGMLSRRDQTLTHFGFSARDLRQAAAAWNGRGIDRLAPVGQALQFARYWDGMDLLTELTRAVWIGPEE